jgi:PilZ domain-containing protein
MPERRQHNRKRVYYGGLLAFNSRSSSFACVVRDFNERGAKIDVVGAQALPEEVDVVIERKSFSRRARLVWRGADSAGLEFCKSTDVMPLEWACRLQASNKANKQLKSRIEQLLTEH